MESFLINFAVKECLAWLKYGIQKAAVRHQARAREMDAVQHVAESRLIITEKDKTALDAVINFIKTDMDTIKCMFHTQAASKLLASYQYILLGFTILQKSLHDQSTSTIVDFTNLNYPKLDDAIAEFKRGYKAAREAYTNDFLTLSDKVWALKIILLCLNMMHKDWLILWKHEIESHFRKSETMHALSKGNGIKYATNVELIKFLMNTICTNVGRDSKNIAVNIIKIFFDIFYKIPMVFDHVEAPYPLSHLAAMCGTVDELKHLLSIEEKLEVKDVTGATPLHFSAEGGNLDCLKYMLSINESVDFVNSEGDTALHLAAAAGHANVVAILLQAKANPNVRNNETLTPLHMAAALGKTDVVKLLAENPFTLIHDECDIELLKNNTLNIDENCAPFLKCYDLNIVTKGRMKHMTALELAASLGNNDVVEILVDSVGKLDHVDKDCASGAIFLAIFNGQTECASTLIENKPDAVLEFEVEGDQVVETIAHAACEENNLDVLQDLLLYDGLVHTASGINQSTPLHYAAYYTDNVNMVEFLLSHGADMNCKDIGGQTPLSLAKNRKNKNLAKFLQRKGANM